MKNRKVKKQKRKRERKVAFEIDIFSLRCVCRQRPLKPVLP
jgi:hypothetical protein